MRIGVDLGGTKIEAIAIGPGSCELYRRRTVTPAEDYAGTVRTVAELVISIEAALGESATVGVGIPGAISPASGLVKNANSTWLNGRRLDSDLRQALNRPVRIANDANCMAISEATDGAGAGARCVFGVIIGTGCGGGIVVDGRVLVGPNAVAGEWGHCPLPWMQPVELPGPVCYCGKNGCVETFLSGGGLAADYLNATGHALDSAQIADAAAGDEQAACAVLDRYENRLARALAAVINVLDPDVIVVGGGVSNIARLYDNVPRLWRQFAFSDRVDTELCPATHGDSSGVRGAAWLWPKDEPVGKSNS